MVRENVSKNKLYKGIPFYSVYKKIMPEQFPPGYRMQVFLNQYKLSVIVRVNEDGFNSWLSSIGN